MEMEAQKRNVDAYTVFLEEGSKMNQHQEVQDLLRSLRLAETANRLHKLLREAEKNDLAFSQFLLDVVAFE